MCEFCRESPEELAHLLLSANDVTFCKDAEDAAERRIEEWSKWENDAEISTAE